MAKVLVIHHDKSSRSALESAARSRHQVEAASDLVRGVHHLAKARPEVVIVGHDKEKKEGLRLMKFLRDNVMKIPVVVVFSRGAGADQQVLMKLGAKGFLEYPVDADRLETAIQDAVRARAAVDAGPPPITAEEAAANLSTLEKTLNNRMKCFAGRNQVYVQSKIGAGSTKPRVALKCSLRAEYGLNKDVYYEHIRDICCGNPDKCPAYQQFMANRDG